jgi:hypothetical protein
MNVTFHLNYAQMATKKQIKSQQASNTYKKLRYKLELFDGFWSIPIAFLIFSISGTLSYQYFGDALISTEYIQYVILAGLIMVFANFIVFMGIRFNFRSLQREIYSRDIKEELKTSLTTWQKICLYLLLYFAYFAAFLFILRTLMTVIV